MLFIVVKDISLIMRVRYILIVVGLLLVVTIIVVEQGEVTIVIAKQFVLLGHIALLLVMYK